jgi:AraC-like DNA-binding protein
MVYFYHRSAYFLYDSAIYGNFQVEGTSAMNGHLDFLFRTTRPQNGMIHPHRHQCYELVYYMQGSGSTRVGEYTHLFHDDTFTLIKPHTLHDEKHATDSEVLFVGFQAELGKYPLREGLYHDQSEGAILALLQRMIIEMQNKRSFYTAKLNHHVGELIIELLRYDVFTTSEPSVDKVIYAKNYIDENVSQKISVDLLADLVGYSYDRFRHLFKEEYGLSPMQYVMSKRFELAKRLLKQTDLSISAISNESGFSNDTQFCSLFKKETGLSPRRYRLQQ